MLLKATCSKTVTHFFQAEQQIVQRNKPDFTALIF
jgi:hypothetical protein